jgi:hypothetical protein
LNNTQIILPQTILGGFLLRKTYATSPVKLALKKGTFIWYAINQYLLQELKVILKSGSKTIPPKRHYRTFCFCLELYNTPPYPPWSYPPPPMDSKKCTLFWARGAIRVIQDPQIFSKMKIIFLNP